MERLMKNRVVFLEFNGIPGSGKTTLSDRVIENMKGVSYTVESYHQLIEKPTRNNLKRLVRYLFSIKLSSFKIGYLALMYLITNKKLNHENGLRVISLIVLFDFYQKKSLANDEEVILVDQGMVQQMVSMLFESELIAEKYVKKLIRYTQKKDMGIFIVNIDLDINESFERLTRREGNISRIQKLKKDTAMHTLIMQQNNFNKIRKIIRELDLESITVNTQGSIETNVLLLENYIKGMKPPDV
jgi:thymidylate kinase